ncbi:MAG: hypothetical protein IJV89_00685 [Lentisphaeria bacterium]|nr:hypothetical protein [Lentisphaeria bacterium]
MLDLKTLEQSSIKAKDEFNHARSVAALMKGEVVLQRFKKVVQDFPDLEPAREKLRELELEKLKKNSIAAQLIGAVMTAVKLPKIKNLTYTDPLAAIAVCEDLLAINLNNTAVLYAMADAALAMDAPFIAVEALSFVKRFSPKDSKLAAKMAVAKDKLERIRRPTKKINDADGEAVIQQLIDGNIYDADQAQILIKRFTKELMHNDSVDMRKKLAEAYMVAEDYENAQKEYKAVAERLGALDPMIDKATEKAYLCQIDESLKLLRATPEEYEDAEGQIAELEAHRQAYRLKKAKKRSEVYPKDAILHFELGQIYFELKNYAAAMEEFKLSGRSLQKEAESRFAIGQCLYESGDIQRGLDIMEEFYPNMEAGRTLLTGMYTLAEYHLAQGNEKRYYELMHEIVRRSARFMDAAKRVAEYEAAHPEEVIVEEEDKTQKGANDDLF